MVERVHDYHDGHRYFHDRFDTRRLADRAVEVRNSDRLDEWAVGPIAEANMFFLATCDHRGLPTCSYKGGERGFVRILDERTLVFPNYDGNGRYLSMGNLRVNPNIGMLFIDFEEGGRIRVQGQARIDESEDLLCEYPGAQFMVRVEVNEVFRNCPRYIHRYQFEETSQYVPRDGYEAPIPEWKLMPELNPYLAADDPARER